MRNDNTVEFTYLKSNTPLTKSFTREGNEIKIEAPDYFKKGTAYHQSIEFYDLPKLLDEMGPNEAIMAGVMPIQLQDQMSGVTCVTTTQEGINDSMDSCSKKDIKYEANAGNGVIILKVGEPGRGRNFMCPARLHAILCVLIPGFEGIACFSRGSSSSRIKSLGKRSYQFYILTDTPDEIPDFIETIHKKLWIIDFVESKLGYVKVARNGDYLERSDIDRVMKSPHQLDVCGTPQVGAGIEVSHSEVTWHGFERAVNCAHYMQLTEEEESYYKSRVEASKKKLRWDSKRAEYFFTKGKHEEFRAVRVRQLENEHSTFKPTETELNILKFQFDREDDAYKLNENSAELHSAFVLHFSDGRNVTVADVVKNPESFDGCTLADPIEGSIHFNGKQCAMFHGKEKPYIESMANGGCEYFLMSEPVFFDYRREFECDGDNECSLEE